MHKYIVLRTDADDFTDMIYFRFDVVPEDFHLPASLGN